MLHSPPYCHGQTNGCLCSQLVPSREAFLEKLGTPDEELYQQMGAFLDAFQPVLQDIHGFLVKHDLDDPTRV